MLLSYAGHRRSTASGGGFDPALEWLADPGFDSAATWDTLGNGDVNTTYASEMRVLDNAPPATYGATNGLIGIPPNGTYRLTWSLDHVAAAPGTSVQIGIGKASIISFNAPAITNAAWAAGGTQDFVVTAAVSRRFMMKFNSGAGYDFAIPGLSLKRVA